MWIIFGKMYGTYTGNIQKNLDNIWAGLQEASFSIRLIVHAPRDRKAAVLF